MLDEVAEARVTHAKHVGSEGERGGGHEHERGGRLAGQVHKQRHDERQQVQRLALEFRRERESFRVGG